MNLFKLAKTQREPQKTENVISIILTRLNLIIHVNLKLTIVSFAILTKKTLILFLLDSVMIWYVMCLKKNFKIKKFFKIGFLCMYDESRCFVVLVTEMCAFVWL